MSNGEQTTSKQPRIVLVEDEAVDLFVGWRVQVGVPLQNGTHTAHEQERTTGVVHNDVPVGGVGHVRSRLEHGIRVAVDVYKLHEAA
jgi:hypothetical protein